MKKKEMLTSLELELFFGSTAFLLRAGVIASEAPDIIGTDLEKGKLKKVCENLSSLLENGEADSLSSAMKKSGFFPIYSVKMIILGEISGRLETTTELLSKFYRQQDIISSNIKSALTGPLLLLATMVLVLFFLILYVLPVFQEVFTSLGSSTNNNMEIAMIASKVVLVLTLLFLVFIILLVIGFLVPQTQDTALIICKIFSPIRSILYTLSAARLTQGLSMLLASGLDGETSLRYVAPMVTDKSIQKKLPSCLEKVEKGKDLGSSLVETNILGGFESKMLLSAARAGQTSLVMERLAEYYAQSVNNEIDSALSIVEPLLVAILSISIGIILLSVMLPLIGIMSSLG